MSATPPGRTVLVTGGSGFIGSHVVDELRRRGFVPRIFDLALPAYHPCDEVEAVVGDVNDGPALAAAIAGCDAVVHLAAVADVADVDADPERAVAINEGGTVSVLEAAERAGVRRVVFGSTVWVYSDCEERAVDESTPIRPPAHTYTATKIAGERTCRAFAERGSVECTILRFGIPYGPRARDAAVVPAFVGRAARGEPLTLAGGGVQSRPFVYVEDLAAGIVSGLDPVAANRTYNLASERPVTIREVADVVRNTVGDTELVHTPARADDFDGRVISNERAARELGWSARTPFEEGVERYVYWWRTTVRRRVLVVSADIGEGHDLPARAIAADLVREAPGTEVAIEDGLAAMGRLATKVVRDGSWLAFNWLPWLFEAQYFLLTRFAPTRWFSIRTGLALFGRGLMRAIGSFRPDAIVSTYPGTTVLLGEMRRRGTLELPVVSAITDLAGLRFWAHPGVDLHTVTHRESIAEVERIAGPGSARWARPPTSPEFLAPRYRDDARRALELPAGGKFVVVSGGGWGIGDLTSAVRASLRAGASTVACLCGHSERARERLEREFGADERVRVLGFTDRMSDLLAAADALVHSTAGLTVLEAQIRGCPVVSYGFGIGHVRVNDRAYERFGLAATARSPKRLESALRDALRKRPEPDPSFAALPSVASLCLAAQPRRPRAASEWRRRVTRVATRVAIAVFVGGWALASDDVFPIFAGTLDMRPTTSVSTARAEVGLMIDAPPSSAPRLAALLHRDGARASFVVREPDEGWLPASLTPLGDEAIPGIGAGGPIHWMRTRGDLRATAETLGLSGHFVYAAPPKGFSLGSYAMAHSLGAPVAPAVRISSRRPGSSPDRGDIVEVDSNSGSSREVDAAVARLRAAGLRAVPVGVLLGRPDHSRDRAGSA